MKLLIVSAPIGHQDTVKAMLDSKQVEDVHWFEHASNGRFTLSCFVVTTVLQEVLDFLQRQFQGSEDASVRVMDVESSYPDSAKDRPVPGLTRGELAQIASNGARADQWFYGLVALSTLVAAFGLVRDNVAVIIGAMVIAPLLGPNLSFALATSLADRPSALSAMRTLLTGTLTGFAIALVMGLVWPSFPIGHELISRTQVTLDSALLAIAAGAAAVLSLTRGMSSVLVGVMVAVALIPPLATAGLFMGRGMFDLALGGLLTLAVNITAINLAAHVTFALTGVAPRTAALAKTARKRTLVYVCGWLIALTGLLYFAQVLATNLSE